MTEVLPPRLQGMLWWTWHRAAGQSQPSAVQCWSRTRIAIRWYLRVEPALASDVEDLGATAEHDRERLPEDAQPSHGSDREGDHLLGLPSYQARGDLVARGGNREQHGSELPALGLREPAEVHRED